MNPELKLLAIDVEARSNVLNMAIQNYHSARFALEQQKKGVEELKHQVQVQRVELSEVMHNMNVLIEKEQNKAKIASPLAIK